MPIIEVAKAFMLKDDDHKLTQFIPGRYEVSDEVASHWYVQAHLKGFEEPPPKTGTDQQAVLLAQQAARLNEPVPDSAQPPAEMIPKPKQANQFAGRRTLPKQDQTPSFIDPASR